jgi:hypothetical protein
MEDGAVMAFGLSFEVGLAATVFVFGGTMRTGGAGVVDASAEVSVFVRGD